MFIKFTILEIYKMEEDYSCGDVRVKEQEAKKKQMAAKLAVLENDSKKGEEGSSEPTEKRKPLGVITNMTPLQAGRGKFSRRSPVRMVDTIRLAPTLPPPVKAPEIPPNTMIIRPPLNPKSRSAETKTAEKTIENSEKGPPPEKQEVASTVSARDFTGTLIPSRRSNLAARKNPSPEPSGPVRTGKQNLKKKEHHEMTAHDWRGVYRQTMLDRHHGKIVPMVSFYDENSEF